MATVGELMRKRGIFAVPPAFGAQDQGPPGFPMLPSPGNTPPFNPDPAAAGPGMMGGQAPAILGQQGLDPSGITVNPPDMPSVLRNITGQRANNSSPTIGSFQNASGQQTVGDLLGGRSQGPTVADMLAARQPQAPYDYGAEVDRLIGPEKKMSTWAKIAQVLGPALMAAGGNTAGANQMIGLFAEQKQDRQRLRHETLRELIQANLRARNPYTIGRNRLTYNPETGENTTIYDGNQDFEDYAAALDLAPGTPAYFDAVENFVLKGHGPAAVTRGKEMDDYRTANDAKMEAMRAANRSKLRSQPTYRDLNPLPPRSGRGGGGGGKRAPTATGPGGVQLHFNGKDWVDEQGRPYK